MKKKTKSLTLVLPVRFPKDGKLRKRLNQFVTGTNAYLSCSNNSIMICAVTEFLDNRLTGVKKSK